MKLKISFKQLPGNLKIEYQHQKYTNLTDCETVSHRRCTPWRQKQAINIFFNLWIAPKSAMKRERIMILPSSHSTTWSWNQAMRTALGRTLEGWNVHEIDTLSIVFDVPPWRILRINITEKPFETRRIKSNGGKMKSYTAPSLWKAMIQTSWGADIMQVQSFSVFALYLILKGLMSWKRIHGMICAMN